MRAPLRGVRTLARWWHYPARRTARRQSPPARGRRARFSGPETAIGLDPTQRCVGAALHRRAALRGTGHAKTRYERNDRSRGSRRRLIGLYSHHQRPATASPASIAFAKILGVLASRAKLDTMANKRRHYPWSIYVLTVVCGLGLACVALGIADGWVLIAAGVAAIAISLVRLHVILDRRRVGVGPRPLPLDRAAVPKD